MVGRDKPRATRNCGKMFCRTRAEQRQRPPGRRSQPALARSASHRLPPLPMSARRDPPHGGGAVTCNPTLKGPLEPISHTTATASTHHPFFHTPPERSQRPRRPPRTAIPTRARSLCKPSLATFTHEHEKGSSARGRSSGVQPEFEGTSRAKITHHAMPRTKITHHAVPPPPPPPFFSHPPGVTIGLISKATCLLGVRRKSRRKTRRKVAGTARRKVAGKGSEGSPEKSPDRRRRRRRTVAGHHCRRPVVALPTVHRLVVHHHGSMILSSMVARFLGMVLHGSMVGRDCEQGLEHVCKHLEARVPPLI